MLAASAVHLLTQIQRYTAAEPTDSAGRRTAGHVSGSSRPVHGWVGGAAAARRGACLWCSAGWLQRRDAAAAAASVSRPGDAGCCSEDTSGVSLCSGDTTSVSPARQDDCGRCRPYVCVWGGGDTVLRRAITTAASANTGGHRQPR